MSSTSVDSLPLIERSDAPDLRGELSSDKIISLFELMSGLASAVREVQQDQLSKGLNSRLKADGSVVTDIDLEGERAARDYARQKLPEAGILGEEFGHDNPAADYQIVLDCVDGTLDLDRGIPTWGAVSALYYKGHPIVATIDHPELQIRVQAAFGQGTTQNGQSIKITDQLPEDLYLQVIALSPKLCYEKFDSREVRFFDALQTAFPQQRIFFTCFSQTCSATGRVDASVEWNLKLWDIASQRLLVEEAGGRFEIFRRSLIPDENRYRYCVVAGKPRMVEQILDLFEKTDSA